MTANLRLVPSPDPDGNGPVLVLIPFAGGGVTAFRDWAPALEDLATVTAVQLPGREHLFGQPPLSSMAEVLDQLVPLVEAMRPRPVVLFGHSMGAAIAFAAARELRRRAAPPVALIVSGAGSPDRRDPTDLVHLLDDAALVRRTIDYGGVHPELLENQDMLSLLVGTLRADFRVLETWFVQPQPPLDIPVTVLRGVSDVSVTDYQAGGWREHAAWAPDEHLFAGGHFFIQTARTEVLTTIRGILAAVPRRAATAP